MKGYGGGGTYKYGEERAWSFCTLPSEGGQGRVKVFTGLHPRGLPAEDPDFCLYFYLIYFLDGDPVYVC